MSNDQPFTPEPEPIAASNNFPESDPEPEPPEPEPNAEFAGMLATLHVPRGPWDINFDSITEVHEISDAEVLVVTHSQGSYRLTCEEAAPLL